MFIIHDRALDLYRKGTEWVADINDADQFVSGEVARKIARVLALGYGRDIVAEPA